MMEWDFLCGNDDREGCWCWAFRYMYCRYLKEGFGWIDARYREVWISIVEQQVGDLIAGANKAIEFNTAYTRVLSRWISLGSRGKKAYFSTVFSDCWL